MTREELETIKNMIWDTTLIGSSEEAVLKYFNGDDLAAKVYRDKYESGNDSRMNDATPDRMHERIAKSLARIEAKYTNPISEKKIYNLLKDFKYIVPGGSVMFGLNNEDVLVSLGNCFVIGNFHEKDSYGTIMRRDEELVQLMKRRGGVGQDLSFIRPKGSSVNNAAKFSSGIVPFAKRYSATTKEVAQEGRRGAAMLTVDFQHEDALDLIEAKANQDQITGANISIKIDDDIMDSIVSDDSRNTITPMNDDGEFNVSYAKHSLFPKKLFDKLISNARDYSEPGILFWDKVNNQIDSLYYQDFDPISTNPCGELPLSPYESCRLMSMNLFSYVKNPFTGDSEFDYDKFEEDVIVAQRLMDDIVDLEIEKVNNILITLKDEKRIQHKYSDQKESSLETEISLWKKILDKTKKGRRTGLGYTALADVFAALNLRYGSKESIDIARRIAESLLKSSYKSSIIMAKERGCFPVNSAAEFANTYNSKFIETIKELFYDEPEIIQLWEKFGRRNIQNLAIAPTGTISIMTQTSSGIEPVFNLRYTRRTRAINKSNGEPNIVMDDNGELWEEFTVVHKNFDRWFKATVPKEDLVDLASISDKDFNNIVKESPYYKSTSYEINPIDKITLQGVTQEYIDSSISVTHNLPEDVTKEKVKELAIYAWEIGCKGFTVYREGSRGGILINKKAKKSTFSSKDAEKRPKKIDCDFHSTMIDGDKWIVLVGLLNNNPYEVFSFKENDKVDIDTKESLLLIRVKRGVYNLVLEKNGNVIINDVTSYFETPEEEFITRLISTSLRHGTNIKHVYDQLVKSKGNITDFSKSIARVLKKYIKEQTEDASKAELCPECGNTLRFESGCVSCSCGYSKCS